jgi:hypothetical protein
MTAADDWADLEALYAAASPGPWEAGHHPAIPTGGAIIRPVTFGSRVRVLPKHEGGHVMIGEADAAFIAAIHDAFPKLIEAARRSDDVGEGWPEDAKDWIVDEKAAEMASDATGNGTWTIRASVRAYLDAARDLKSHPFAARHPVTPAGEG